MFDITKSKASLCFLQFLSLNLSLSLSISLSSLFLSLSFALSLSQQIHLKVIYFRIFSNKASLYGLFCNPFV